MSSFGGPFELVVSICRDLKSFDIRPGEQANQFAKNVIQRLFMDSSIDLCAITQNCYYLDENIYNLVLSLIDVNTTFFEAVLSAHDTIARELWQGIYFQLEHTHQVDCSGSDNLLFACISSYVTRLLPTEAPSAPVPIPTGISQRMRTPLNLFLPTSPVLQKMKFETPPGDRFRGTHNVLHPKHVSMFCEFVNILTTSDSFPSSSRMLILRYILKQYHIFCMFDTPDPDLLSIKGSLHSNPPFSSQLYDFLYTFMEQAPTAWALHELIGIWSTYCRPWRYVDDLSSSNGSNKWMAFVRSQERFYRIILGRILRKLTESNVTADMITPLRAIVEFGWRDPMVLVLRELSIDARGHIRRLLDKLVDWRCSQSLELRQLERHEGHNNSLWRLLASPACSPEASAKQDLISKVDEILKDVDSNIGTRFMEKIAHRLEPTREVSYIQGRAEPISELPIPQYDDTPKCSRVPDHQRDPVTGLMFLTDIGKQQVFCKQRRFDFKACREVIPHWMTKARSYECPPLVWLCKVLNRQLNKLPYVQSLASQYNENSATGKIVRLLMDPPCPNPRSPIASPVFSSQMGKGEEVDKERKKFESDAIWEARRTFLFRHWNDFPEKDRLRCLSQIFINVNIFGCEYDAKLMKLVNEMGTGVISRAKALENERSMVRASQGRAMAELTRKEDESVKQVLKRPLPDSPNIDEKLQTLKSHMLQAYSAPPTALLNMLSRVKLSYDVRTSPDGCSELRIRDMLVFKHKFRRILGSRDLVIRTVVDSFLHCEPSSASGVVLFNEALPISCYHNWFVRSMDSMRKHLSPADKTYKGLLDAAAKCNLLLTKSEQRLQGWSERMDIILDDVLLISKVLEKGECVKQKKDAAVDNMCSIVCNAICQGTVTLEETENGLRLVLPV